MNGVGGNFAAQDEAWGLTVDIEFGGCRCADEDEQEFGPDVANFADNNWSCKCLNSDLYLSKPAAKYECFNRAVPATAVAKRETAAECALLVTAGVATHPNVRLNDANGK